MRRSLLAVTAALGVLGHLPAGANAQGCASTCPPLDDRGLPIPSLCTGQAVPSSYLRRSYDLCGMDDQPALAPGGTFSLEDLVARGSIVVLANHYIGCNAGRRESGVFAHVAQRYHDLYGDRIIFVTSLKGGSSCATWSNIYRNDAKKLYPGSAVVPSEMPWTVSDLDYRLRDDFFTTPFGHPSYAVLAPGRDGGAVAVRGKFVGPCCGYIKYSDCQADTARELDGMLSTLLDGILAEMDARPTRPAVAAPRPIPATQAPPPRPAVQQAPAPTPQEDSLDSVFGIFDFGPGPSPASQTPVEEDEDADVLDVQGPVGVNFIDNGSGSCQVYPYGDWSPCSVDCGTETGTQFRWRYIIDGRPPLPAFAGVNDEGEEVYITEAGDEVLVGSADAPPGADRLPCPSPVEVRSCAAPGEAAFSKRAVCLPTCVPELGATYRGTRGSPDIEVVADGFASPRDVAFHPTPGLHLGNRSEGRDFEPSRGEEAWIANGFNHSVSIVASLGDDEAQTTFSRRDRGYYHYMVNITALSFNAVPPTVSGRDEKKETFNYFAVCNDNRNNYLGSKEENFFMGPTLYDTDPDPAKRNVVNRLGDACNSTAEECYLLHADMLHESPACVGITHDPEIDTAYGTVYWAFDSSGDRKTGQLVRFDFQQPHGPGSMDHSVAAVRRYPEVKLARGADGVHAGMVVHPETKTLFVANPGGGNILAIRTDSGSYSRTARVEYPIYSNRLPSFEYSIWECVDQHVFADGLDTPTGLALSPDGDRLFVAERGTGIIHVYDVASGSLVDSLETGYETINGLAFSPKTGVLHFVDADTGTLVAVRPTSPCAYFYRPRLAAGYTSAVAEATNALGDDFSISKDYTCAVNPVPPNAGLFDQVHVDTGYASDDPNVQASMAGMDAAAALLANRTDCEVDSELNFDALLLGGYYCHPCLPRNEGASCDAGGTCRNVQWRGFVCDNEYIVRTDEVTKEIGFYEPGSTERLGISDLELKWAVTYRFTIEGTDTISVHASDRSNAPALSLSGNDCGCARDGPLLVTPGKDIWGNKLFFRRKVVGRNSSLASPVVGIAIERELDASSVIGADNSAGAITVYGHSAPLMAMAAAALFMLV